MQIQEFYRFYIENGIILTAWSELYYKEPGSDDRDGVGLV
ncbi:Putative protein [Zobellia galactanivorans]|uniref:Uncharacterized protein n=1 Tax=Zobellia galactanivorans (strain DSM 12802 / CCUG 47099 / CIP 106680 / NCIMB 13871 / Dsij) TaxID=63186 RepID=G0L0C4_ZOBGA|nr:Putative protein [Zobellia galactanivorans]